MLALTGKARRWEPQAAAVADLLCRRLVRGGWRLRVRLAASWPRAVQITAAITRLQALDPADQPKPSLQSRKDTPRAMEPRPPGATAVPPS